MIVATGTASWAVVLYVIGALALSGIMVGLAALLGQRHSERTTGARYESGLPPAGDLPSRFSVEFYLVAVIFVLFDLEAVFIFAWAVAARELGWTGYVEVTVFIVLLAAALAYAWATGALEWGTRARQGKAGAGRR